MWIKCIFQIERRTEKYWYRDILPETAETKTRRGLRSSLFTVDYRAVIQGFLHIRVCGSMYNKQPTKNVLWSLWPYVCTYCTCDVNDTGLVRIVETLRVANPTGTEVCVSVVLWNLVTNGAMTQISVCFTLSVEELSLLQGKALYVLHFVKSYVIKFKSINNVLLHRRKVQKHV